MFGVHVSLRCATLKSMSEEKMSAETYVVSGGRPAHEHDAPVNPPIILSSTYRLSLIHI